MSKVMFVGDIHGKSKQPLGRLLDYNEGLYAKLECIVNFCNNNSVEYIIHLGDIHDTWNTQDEWKNRVISIFKQFKGKVYSLVGNHDLASGNESFYYKTCLRTLELSGALTILKEPLKLNLSIILPLSLDIKQAKKDFINIIGNTPVGLKCICVGHNYYEFGLDKNAGFTEDFFVENDRLGVDVILGHDHTQYPDCTAGNTTIIRPGSLMRTELSETTIEQKPRVLLYDDSKLEYTYIEVPHRPINQIYNVQEYRMHKSTAKALRQISSNIEDISKYVHSDNTVVRCSDALKELQCPTEEYEYLRSVYQMCGQEF